MKLSNENQMDSWDDFVVDIKDIFIAKYYGKNFLLIKETGREGSSIRPSF
jgi:hypothetical protein